MEDNLKSLIQTPLGACNSFTLSLKKPKKLCVGECSEMRGGGGERKKFMNRVEVKDNRGDVEGLSRERIKEEKEEEEGR